MTILKVIMFFVNPGFLEIKIATPRGLPETSGELAHLVKGLKLIEKNRTKIGI